MSEQPIAFVTGTSTGFGNLIARDLAGAGYRTFATMRDTAGRNAAAKSELEKLGVTVLEVDVTSDASVAAAAKIVDAVGPVAVLVNNAGTAHFGVTEAHTTASVAKQFDTNVLSTVRVNRAFLPAMRAAGKGLVVYVSSVVGRIVIPMTGVYTASKFALEALAETMSYELRPFGVDVAIVQPGPYGTNILSATILPDDAARVEAYGDVARLAQGLQDAMASAAGNPQEVADAVLSLARAQAGTRPLRTVVGANEATLAINARTAPIQRAVVEGFGFGSLLGRETVTA